MELEIPAQWQRHKTNGKICLKRGDNPKKREMKGGDNPPQKREVKGGDNPLLTSCRPSSPLSPTSPPTFPLKQTSFKWSSLIWAKFHKSHFTEWSTTPPWLQLAHLYRLLSLHLPVYIYDCISPIYIGRYPPQHPQFAANLIETRINPYFIICAIVNFSVEPLS